MFNLCDSSKSWKLACVTTDFLLNLRLGNVNLFGWLGLLPMSGSDLESNEGGKDLAAAVDVIYTCDTKNQEISVPFILVYSHEIF